ncbi:UNVERIFIED_CONTAM: hypothetical protein GTU68_055569 [Idotea baltica]|nr:hypothetical protein [Idotea baltica]
MTRKPSDQAVQKLRRGWTTGACATAATKAALLALWGAGFPERVRITLPKGERPEFTLAQHAQGTGWAEVGIEKDAGDDPDVTHGALIVVRVTASDGGVHFKAGSGVGIVTKAGLPIDVGQAAINPVPRQMMIDVVEETATRLGKSPDIEIEISVPDGEALAEKTWNPRLGIKGGISILGTTGVVRPFSCAAWIASIHRGIDVARADGLPHVAGCTGATSERVVQGLYGLPDHAMLDMGDFAGGLLKYLAKNPVPKLTIGGGIGKMTKLAQGARDLHSKRSQVDFKKISQDFENEHISSVNTALEVYDVLGDVYASWVAKKAQKNVEALLLGTGVTVNTVVIDRAGKVLAKT